MKDQINNQLKSISIAAILASTIAFASVSAQNNDQSGRKWQNCENQEDCQKGQKQKRKFQANNKRGSRFVDNPEDANEIANKIKERFDSQMSSLKERLQITSEQESLWANYVNTRSANLPNSDQILARSKMREMDNTPEKDEVMLSHMKLRIQNMENQLSAYKALYNSSSSQQQEILKNTRMMRAGNKKPNNQHQQGRGNREG